MRPIDFQSICMAPPGQINRIVQTRIGGLECPARQS
jgi:hypothetical protein